MTSKDSQSDLFELSTKSGQDHNPLKLTLYLGDQRV